MMKYTPFTRTTNTPTAKAAIPAASIAAGSVSQKFAASYFGAIRPSVYAPIP